MKKPFGFAIRFLKYGKGSLPTKIDFAILTIIDPELEAVKNTFGLDGPVKHEGRIFYHGKIIGPTGKEYSIICTKSRHVGNNAAALAAADVIDKLDPDFFLLVGIAGGVKGRKNLQLGDVVISDAIEYYELEKESGSDRFDRSGKLANPSMVLLNNSEIVSSENWWEGIMEERPADKSNSSKSIIGRILSGEKLLGDPNSQLLKKLLSKYDRALAVEMESGGFATAVLEKSIPKQKDYLVIRGISDFCNEEDNQEFRNDWRKYSAHAAAIFAKKLIEETQIEDEQKSAHELYLSDFQNSVGSKLKVEFSLKIKTPEKIIPADSLDNFLANSRRVMLKGQPGTGKSSIVTRLSRYLIENEKVPVLINLKRWKPEYSKELEKNSLQPKEKMDVIMKCSVVPITIEQVESFEKEICIIVDGLNEISGGAFGQETPQMIMGIVSDYIRKNYEKTTGLVTDRMQQRNFLEDWHASEMLPLETGEVEMIIEERFEKGSFNSLDKVNREILSNPYFLNFALNSDSPKFASASAALEKFFKDQMDFVENEIDLLAELVFQETKNHDISFKLDNFEKLGESNIAKLKSGVQDQGDGRFIFDHQLKHDYLLSRTLVKNQAMWDGLNFDVASLESNSLESIFMAFEQIKEKADGEKFLLEVYDWNLRAAIKSIQHADKMQIKNSSYELILAILALVAIKQFDPSHYTSTKAKDSLVDFGTTEAQELAKAKDLKEIINIIDKHGSGPEWFDKWKSLFSKNRNSKISEIQVDTILSDNSLTGWTASNVLHECDLDEDNQLQIRTIYKSSKGTDYKRSTIRWRAVHVLGPNPSNENSELLFCALENDSYPWVRYGAGRSLIEMAAKTESKDLRKNILKKIEKILPTLKINVVEEIGNTIFYKNAKGSWEEDALFILKKIRDLNGDEDKPHKGKWQGKIKEFEEGKWKN